MNVEATNPYSLFPVICQESQLVAKCLAYLLPEEQRCIETSDERYKTLMQNHRINTLRSDLLDIKNWIDGQLHEFLNTPSIPESVKQIKILLEGDNLVTELQAESKAAAETEINPLTRERELNKRLVKMKQDILLVLAKLDSENISQIPQGPFLRLKNLLQIQKQYDAAEWSTKVSILTELLENNEIPVMMVDLIDSPANKRIRTTTLLWLCNKLCEPLIKDIEELKKIQNIPEKADEYNLKNQLARFRAEHGMAAIEEILDRIPEGQEKDDLIATIVENIYIPHNFLVQALELLPKVRTLNQVDETFTKICTMIVDQNLVQSILDHFNRNDEISNSIPFELIPILIQKGKVEEAESLIGRISAETTKVIRLHNIMEAWCTQSRFDKARALINLVDNQNNSKDALLEFFIRLLLQHDRPEDASQEFNQIVGQSHHKYNTLGNFIDYYVLKKRYDLAEGYFNQITGCNEALCCFGGIVRGYLKKGEIENARRILAEYKSKISLPDGAPTNYLASYYDFAAVEIINAYLAQGNLSEAKALALTLSVNNVNEPLHKVALAFIQQGNIEEAKNLAERINDGEGYTMTIMREIYSFHIKEKNLDAAKALLPKVLPVRGSGDFIFGPLAKAYFENGNRAEADALNQRCQIPIRFENPASPAPTPTPQPVVPVAEPSMPLPPIPTPTPVPQNPLPLPLNPTPSEPINVNPPTPTPPPSTTNALTPKPRITLLQVLANKIIGCAQKVFQLLKYFLSLLTAMPKRLYRR